MCSQLLRQLDHFGGIVSARSAQHRNFPLGFLDRNFHHAKMLRARQRRALAGSAAGHQKINPRVDLPPDQPPHRGFVELQILLKRSDHRCPASRKHFQLSFMNKTS